MPTSDMSAAVEQYLAERQLSRSVATAYNSRVALTEYLRFARPHDIRQGVIDYLA